jgi:NADH-ubiquinone oxidoreductase chain 5
MLALILFSPLFGFLSGCFLGYRLGLGVCVISTLSIFCAFLSSLILFYNILISKVIYKINLGKWICLNLLQVDWFFCIDSLTVIMLIVVTFISTLVHIYSTEYMEHDPHLPRFMCYLSLFTFFMLILITANNFLQLFLGWEGVGLSSYLLINFWFTRIQANKAAIKAMLINRIGDFFLLFAIFCIYNLFDTLNYDIVFSVAPFFKNFYFNFSGYYFSAINIICLLLFIGAMGKSAQIGLHVWLPDAMEGPTPVSALIHAATMVTAGVFLIIRCSFFFELAPKILQLIIYIGALTAFFAASTGLFQNDIKKIIAYSTCSQLGYMIFACGLSTYDVAIFHLSNHAFFKALLFLGSGSIIHAVYNEQDMRKMGGLKSLLPFSYSIILIGSLALIGFPFLTGFYSKDLILEAAFAQQTSFSFFCYILGSLSVLCTSFYSTRLIFMVFLAEPNGNKFILLNAHESSIRIGLPLFLLALLSISIGYVSKDLFVGLGTPFWGNAIFINPEAFVKADSEFICYVYKILPLFLTFLGAFFALVIYILNLNLFFKSKQSKFSLVLTNFLVKKWYFDKFNNQSFGLSILNLSYGFSYQNVDRGILEFFGPFTLVKAIQTFLTRIKKIQPLFFIQTLSFFFYFFIFIFIIALNEISLYKILIPLFILIANNIKNK